MKVIIIVATIALAVGIAIGNVSRGSEAKATPARVFLLAPGDDALVRTVKARCNVLRHWIGCRRGRWTVGMTISSIEVYRGLRPVFRRKLWPEED